MTPAEPGEPLRRPDPDWRTSTRVGRFAADAARRHGAPPDADAEQLWRWSVTELEDFWQAIWDHFGVRSDTDPGPVLDGGGRALPGARWFTGARLNYARHLLEDADPERALDDEVAIVAHSQTRDPVELTWAGLRAEVARVRQGLADLGVRPGDRVAAYLPNLPETVVAHLACASLGAVWASCAPEFGARSVVDRFAQVEPTVLLVVTGYGYADKTVDRAEEVEAIRAGLPTVEHVVHVPYAGDPPPGSLSWADLGEPGAEPAYEPVAFDHPLAVLFSSGTTGLPKPIVHGHGGILLEHLKNHALSWDLGPGDRMLWFSTTAWMMWNSLVSALLVRCSIVLLDGHPAWPDPGAQWRLAAETGTTVLGLSPGLVMECRRRGLHPAAESDLSRLRQVCAAGSPLPASGYAWLLDELGPVLLNVGSGGTDVCSAIVQGHPGLPVWAGEISGRCLGVAADAFDPDGRPVVGELGELVITEPMPSMPVGFWGDDDGRRYRAAYFEDFPGVWRHGDWIRFSEQGSCVITGRSDATLNRGGVRLGTADFYAVVEEVEGVEDALVVHLEDPDGGNGELLLFVVAPDGLDDALRTRVVREVRGALSPRHVPDTVVAVPSVPRSRTGKKLELPAKRILQGRDPDEVASRDALADPTSLDAFAAYAASRSAS